MHRGDGTHRGIGGVIVCTHRGLGGQVIKPGTEPVKRNEMERNEIE